MVAPYLKRAIPESLWSARPCLVVHPGIRGDRGPSSLDWAIHDGEDRWGVTVLQANAEFDAGDIWAHREFAMRPASKSALYRHEVADAASAAVQDALLRYRQGTFTPAPLDYGCPECSRSGSAGHEAVGPDGGLVGPYRRDHAQPALLGQQPRSVRRRRRPAVLPLRCSRGRLPERPARDHPGPTTWGRLPGHRRRRHLDRTTQGGGAWPA